ncbi:hypothetical protein LCGC14_2154340 [marine sediment metagenome]|uniref:Uncharacterized protein n=1 Tax=marine sediment metagenome TaxID=412755 RepID=A0A0F9DUU2_9ZZZZ
MAQPTQTAQPTQIVQRTQIQHQLTLTRAQLQEAAQQLEQLTERHDLLEQQVIAQLGALEGFDLGYNCAQAEAAAVEVEEKRARKPKEEGPK